MKIRAVVIIDAKGDYIIHGTSGQTPLEMFRAIQPIWNFDPATEHVHYVEVDVAIPGHEEDRYDAPETDAG